MKVTGFSFIRNAVKYDYPIVEAITSILPLCDSFIVAVGNSDDKTRELIEGISPEKIKIIDTEWDDSLREGGKVLAVETNKAFAEIPKNSDWAFYIQGDEVVHEKYHDNIRAAMEKHKDDGNVEGLLFKYKHFFGSYDYVGDATNWYRREIRIVKNIEGIFSYRDAQGFRKHPNDKLKVKLIDAFVYHYGWVRPPEKMQSKQANFAKMYNKSDEEVEERYSAEEFDYSNINSLQRFEETHPKVMQARIQKKNWKFDFDISTNRYTNKERFKRWFEKLTGHRLWEYRNYILLKP